MRQFALLTLILALVAPVAAGSMETLGEGFARSALDALPSAWLHPSLAFLMAALCGLVMLRQTQS